MRAILTALFLLAACGGEYEPAATRAHVDPARASEHFFAAPWPDDRRLAADGSIDTAAFPNPHRGPLFDTVLSTSVGLVKGWGLSAPVYLPFDGSIDPASLPATPKAATTADASVFLVELGTGRRLPLEFEWMPEETSFLPGNVLAVRPSIGFPLEERTAHALLVTTRVKDANGESIGPEESLWRALVTPEEAPDVAEWAPLAAYLQKEGIDPEEIAGATIFTTQDATGELLRVRDTVLESPAPTLTQLSFVRSSNGFVQLQGRYDAPNFQHGTPPFLNEGGGFRFSPEGDALPSGTETLRLTVCYPIAPMPVGGYPVAIYGHGTGGDYESGVDDGTCQRLAAQGVAVVAGDQVLHPPRVSAGNSCFGQPVENCFFNIVNGEAGRTVIRQGAIDHLVQRRLLPSLTIPATIDPLGREVKFDTRHVGFVGHSQGGLTGALYAAFDPDLSGALLSAAGGHLTTTILVRDGGSLRSLAEGPLFLNLPEGEQLSQFHPALALVQSLGEAADPLSYSRLWAKRPQGRRKHVLMISGLEDEPTPPFTAEALAAAAGAVQVAQGHRDSQPHLLWGLAPLAAPFTGNVPAAPPLPEVTLALQQVPGHGHFAFFNHEPTRVTAAEFVSGLVRGRIPTILGP